MSARVPVIKLKNSISLPFINGEDFVINGQDFAS